MKKIFRSLLFSVACLLSVAALAEGDPLRDLRRIHDFIKEAKVYYIATVDQDQQPHVRPFGTINIYDNRLYIQTGRKKKVAQQLLANGKVEICAMKGDRWIRVTGTLVNDPRREAKVSMLDAYPSLKKLYSADDENTMVLYFNSGTAVISSLQGETEVINF